MTTRPKDADSAGDADDLEDEPDGDVDDDAEDDGGEDVEDLEDDEEDDEPVSVLTDADLERIAEVAAAAANSVADRRINQALSPQKKTKPQAKGQPVDTRGAARYIKSVVRDEISDLGLSDQEAKLVRKFAVQMVSVADLSAVEDEDAFASEIVTQAAGMVEEVQTDLRQSLRDDKKRRGGSTQKRQPGKKPKGTNTDDVKSQMEAGRKRAEARHKEGSRR